MADKALILGVNDYKTVTDLRGCVNDVQNMRDLLTRTFGFDDGNIKVLVNDEVTKAKVRGLMNNWLFRDLSPGDRVAFHFSGHGSYIADVTGDEDEDDPVDELLCLHDMDFNRSGSYFLDDELREWTKKVPEGVHLTVFLDNCHSGTGTRLLIPPGKTKPSRKYPRIVEEATAHRVADQVSRSARGIGMMGLEAIAEVAKRAYEPEPEQQVVARFVEPPEEIVERVRVLRARGKVRPPAHALTEMVPGMNHLLLAAAQADQTAADAYIDGNFNGAFTYNLCKILRSAGRQVDRATLIQQLGEALKAGHYSQVPRLEGPALQGPLFAAEGTKPATTPTSPTVPTPPAPMPEVATTPIEMPGRPVESVGDGSTIFRELLATYNRLLDLVGPSGAAAIGAGRAPRVAQRHIIYVHGIGAHPRGFSNAWWNVMGRFTPSLQPGTLNENRHEAYWSDLVNNMRDLSPESQEVGRRLREAVEDRVEQQVSAAAAVAESTDQGPESARAVVPETARALDTARGSLDGFQGFDDFGRYLTDPALRGQIIDRFRAVALPLLRAGAEVEVISHSWGTVIAYEALRQMDGDASLTGTVRHLFTVGSALSIGEVRSRLLPEASDGRKPRLVRRWSNLDAQGDPVGGRLRDHFLVDDEFLNLPAVKCGNIFWVLPNPVCAHSSYFDPDNLRVNQQIFGRLIES